MVSTQAFSLPPQQMKANECAAGTAVLYMLHISTQHSLRKRVAECEIPTQFFQ